MAPPTIAPPTAVCATASVSGIAIASPNKNSEIAILRSCVIISPKNLVSGTRQLLVSSELPKKLCNVGRKRTFGHRRRDIKKGVTEIGRASFFQKIAM